MSGEPAGTPEANAAQSDAQSAAAQQDGSEQVTVSKQFKDEALRSWKPAAEKVNQLEAQLQDAERRLQELQRQAYGGGQAATDPQAELVRQLQEQAQFDPVARATLLTMEQAAISRAEVWLARQVADVPAAKRAQVEDYIRTKGYQVTAEQALRALADPDVKTLAEQLRETQQELERLKGAKPNGSSPSFAPPASVNSDDGKVQESISRAEYLAIVSRGSDRAASDEDKERARTLARAVATNKTRLEG
jgi:hypothetical protein